MWLYLMVFAVGTSRICGSRLRECKECFQLQRSFSLLVGIYCCLHHHHNSLLCSSQVCLKQLIFLIPSHQGSPYNVGYKQVSEEAYKTLGSEQQWADRLHFKSARQWGAGKSHYSFEYFHIIYLQKDFKEISEADEIDKKTLVKLKKIVARDSDII